MPHRQTHHRPCMTSPHAKNSWSTSTWTRRGRRWSRRHVTIFYLNFGFWNKYFWKKRAHSYQKYVVNLPNKVIQTDTRMYALTNMKIKADKPLKMANPSDELRQRVGDTAVGWWYGGGLMIRRRVDDTAVGWWYCGGLVIRRSVELKRNRQHVMDQNWELTAIIRTQTAIILTSVIRRHAVTVERLEIAPSALWLLLLSLTCNADACVHVPHVWRPWLPLEERQTVDEVAL